MKKILVYSHDAYGLGNIRRMLEITSHLVNSDPDVHVLLIVAELMRKEPVTTAARVRTPLFSSRKLGAALRPSSLAASI